MRIKRKEKKLTKFSTVLEENEMAAKSRSWKRCRKLSRKDADQQPLAFFYIGAGCPVGTVGLRAKRIRDKVWRSSPGINRKVND